MCKQNAEGALVLLVGVHIASKHLGNPKTIASLNGFEAVTVAIRQESPVCTHVPMRALVHVCICMYRDR